MNNRDSPRIIATKVCGQPGLRAQGTDQTLPSTPPTILPFLT